MSLLLLYSCTYATKPPDSDKVDPSLRAVTTESSIIVSDTLERLIANGSDDTEDREFAYWLISRRGEPTSAPAAFARAACAGRVAELRGLNAGRFVGEVERYGIKSLELDPTFRHGAAKRMLATLYVIAPAYMVEHGDSETGLEMLLDLVEAWPDDVENHLRLAQAYVVLGDAEPAFVHLCYCVAHAAELRPDHRALLEQLIVEAEAPECPRPTEPEAER